MACSGCGKKKKYLVTKADGSQVEVDSLVAAMNMVRREGGTYQMVRK